ncbi:MAG: carbon-nitrogen hydrolase family protein [Nitrospinae bacterium]|nr:carbon-nitrogen hydrolase family protein [Nitrospinota bacterium]
MAIVAAVQMNSGNKKRENLEKAYSLLTRGVDMGAGLLALPENFSFMGEEREKAKAAEDPESGESVLFLKKFAAEHRVWIVGGSIPIKAGDGKATNTSLLINDKGDVAARYDKVHLFDADLVNGETHRESDFVKRGDKAVVADTPFGRVGLSICYDLRFPELYRRLAAAGAEIIFAPSAFTFRTGKDHWEVLVRARAIENQAYMAAPAQCGVHGHERTTYGNAMIADPWGKVAARASEKETVIAAELDHVYQSEIRKSIPCLEHRVLWKEDAAMNFPESKPRR